MNSLAVRADLVDRVSCVWASQGMEGHGYRVRVRGCGYGCFFPLFLPAVSSPWGDITVGTRQHVGKRGKI